MLSLTMRHTGELFLQTPEAEHALNKRLVLTIDNNLNGESNPYVISAMECELLNTVIWFFDLHLEELVDYPYAPEQSKFALNLMRVKLLAEIESLVKNDITYDLRNHNVSHFDIIDIEHTPA